jgi:hypothetical protein
MSAKKFFLPLKLENVLPIYEKNMSRWLTELIVIAENSCDQLIPDKLESS